MACRHDSDSEAFWLVIYLSRFSLIRIYIATRLATVQHLREHRRTFITGSRAVLLDTSFVFYLLLGICQFRLRPVANSLVYV